MKCVRYEGMWEGGAYGDPMSYWRGQECQAVGRWWPLGNGTKGGVGARCVVVCVWCGAVGVWGMEGCMCVVRQP